MENIVNYTKIAAYIGAAFAVGIGTIGPALGQGKIASTACENIGKYPESSGKIFQAMMFGLVACETSSIYALVIAILLIFLT